ncbi:hypothetical protein [Pseudomonas sp. 24 E 1]|nr:hypothetical protein [Pseudomonas sp. 24 E 1]
MHPDHAFIHILIKFNEELLKIRAKTAEFNTTIFYIFKIRINPSSQLFDNLNHFHNKSLAFSYQYGLPFNPLIPVILMKTQIERASSSDLSNHIRNIDSLHPPKTDWKIDI